MSLKKCLKTKKGWSFLEYAMAFVAITAGVVIGFQLLKSSTSSDGMIQQLFKGKTNSYLGSIRG